jgi:hypothetical protein
MHPFGRRVAVALLALALAPDGRSAAESGDFLCDPEESSAETCVIVGNWSVPPGVVLRFTAPNVSVRGTVRGEIIGRCMFAPTAACQADSDCSLPDRCLRLGEVSLEAAEVLSIETSARVTAVGQPVVGDARGPDGGRITLLAREVRVAGIVSAAAASLLGVEAGAGGTVAIDAERAVVIAPTAGLDASSARGGCGGTIVIGTPSSLEVNGTLAVDASTFGGTISLTARGYLSVAGNLEASNTNSDLRTRPACASAAGGGRIEVDAASIYFTGAARARGAQAAGGVVRVQAEGDVTVDSGVTGPAVNVSGGDGNAFTPGGAFLVTTVAGNVVLARGSIEANGLGSGFGSDAGAFVLRANSARRCEASSLACATAAECPDGRPCLERGGDLIVDAPFSATGGGSLGSGCAACQITASRRVAIGAPIDVGGGRQRGAGGRLEVTGGGDVTVGPGPLVADAADGGSIALRAGTRDEVSLEREGTLRIFTGTPVHADALRDDGVGGEIELEGCHIDVEPSAHVTAEGGNRGGHAGRVAVVARERLVIGPLVIFSALPDGSVSVSYRLEATLAPDAVFLPALELALDPTLAACPGCGNGIPEAGEECDGAGSCGAGALCVQPGLPEECTCSAETCGAVPGVQPGEECDGEDLAGATCTSLGFLGGTLACDARCRFDVGGCFAALCGNGALEPGESCDPGGIDGTLPNFGDATCETLGFPGPGTLTCTADCLAIVTVPHCGASVTDPCMRDDDCEAGDVCAAGCSQCGNGFVDAGEECDEGPSNGSTPNHCRDDCRAPHCGDGIADVAHCAGDPDTVCTTAADCPPDEACIAGEQCDQGSAVCVGGTNAGASCCGESDCPDGDCTGDECERNRDDIPGCCHCGCTAEASACGGPGDCDDNDPCTTDLCDPVEGCRSQPIDDEAARQAIEASRHVDDCVGERMPGHLDRLLNFASRLLDRAAAFRAVGNAKRAGFLVRRARERLEEAYKRVDFARARGVQPACVSALDVVITRARRQAACVPGAPPR